MALKNKTYRKLLRVSGAYFGVLLLFFLGGCKNEDKITAEVLKIPVDLEVSRFDSAFTTAEVKDIPSLKKQYPYLFPEQYPDSIWENKLKDTLQIELLQEVQSTFNDFVKETDSLTLLFKHIKYYFPEYHIPKVVTLTNDVSYQNRIVLADTLLLIGLDNYLGPSHKFYGGFQRYVAATLDRRYLVSDVAGAFAKKVNPAPKDRSFLARMVYYGKELYIKDKIAPFISDAQKIGYAKEQLQWAEANEEQMWRYFIERELLYDTSLKLDARFLDPAPFSKFQLELDNESPGRLGRYVGWQIVRAFMEHNEVSLQQMLRLSADEIFKKSNYKPKK